MEFNCSLLVRYKQDWCGIIRELFDKMEAYLQYKFKGLPYNPVHVHCHFGMSLVTSIEFDGSQFLFVCEQPALDVITSPVHEMAIARANFQDPACVNGNESKAVVCDRCVV